MLQREIDEKVYEQYSYITDKFRDIQRLAATMKNAEDKPKIIQALARLSDMTTDIQRSYDILDRLMAEEPEDETEEQPIYAGKLFG